MDRLLSAPQTTGAGMLGASISGLGYLVQRILHFIAGDEFQKLMGGFLLILFAISSCIAIASAWYRYNSQKHKEHIEAMKEYFIENRMCHTCIETGIEPPGKCPSIHPPDICPKVLREKLRLQRIPRWRRIWMKLNKEESSTI